tara:strand:+ start:28057 stop:28488 length:432 start_codon:yes stop_codon:yes gene_type:complete
MGTKINIQHVENICNLKKLNFTSSRRKVLEILINADNALTAYEILDILKESLPKTKPAIIYRALDFLCENGFVHRIEISNSYMACKNCEHTHVAKFLICESCKKIIELESDSISNDLEKEAKSMGFQIQAEIFEAKGLCKECI